MTLPSNKTALQQMDSDLHDLCQPLTALQCRLEIGKMIGHKGALQEAIDGSLEETQRMFEVIARMRQHLIRAQEFTE
jgi:C4-dicarboxylate-specific signal transduction histidine kinase